MNDAGDDRANTDTDETRLPRIERIEVEICKRQNPGFQTAPIHVYVINQSISSLILHFEPSKIQAKRLIANVKNIKMEHMFSAALKVSLRKRTLNLMIM